MIALHAVRFSWRVKEITTSFVATVPSFLFAFFFASQVKPEHPCSAVCRPVFPTQCPLASQSCSWVNFAIYNYSFMICYMGNAAFQPLRHKTLINHFTVCVDRVTLILILFSVDMSFTKAKWDFVCPQTLKMKTTFM